MFTQLSKRDITLAYIISVIIALIMCVASVAGILYGSDIYPASQVSNNIGTDALNLVVGLPSCLVRCGSRDVAASSACSSGRGRSSISYTSTPSTFLACRSTYSFSHTSLLSP